MPDWIHPRESLAIPAKLLNKVPNTLLFIPGSFGALAPKIADLNKSKLQAIFIIAITTILDEFSRIKGRLSVLPGQCTPELRPSRRITGPIPVELRKLHRRDGPLLQTLHHRR